MSRSSSMPAMIALAAVLTTPVIIEAQSSFADPATVPDTTLLLTGAPIVAGASVYNAQNEMVGCIDEVLSNIGGSDAGVVLSLGGFHGIEGKLVEIPGNFIQSVDDKLMIAGVTKNQLMQLPPYQYGSRS